MYIVYCFSWPGLLYKYTNISQTNSIETLCLWSVFCQFMWISWQDIKLSTERKIMTTLWHLLQWKEEWGGKEGMTKETDERRWQFSNTNRKKILSATHQSFQFSTFGDNSNVVAGISSFSVDAIRKWPEVISYAFLWGVDKYV